jgi:hypothetical protein
MARHIIAWGFGTLCNELLRTLIQINPDLLSAIEQFPDFIPACAQ